MVTKQKQTDGKTSQIDEKDSKKRIGNYSFRTNISFNAKNSNMIYLEITLNDDLQNLIKSVTLAELAETKATYEDYNSETERPEATTLNRYKVKSFVFTALGTNKDFLFCEDLVKKGKVKLSFYTLDKIESFKSYFTQNVKYLLRVLDKMQELNQTVIFKNDKQE